jgi:hypothetical protein
MDDRKVYRMFENEEAPVMALMHIYSNERSRIANYYNVDAARSHKIMRIIIREISIEVLLGFRTNNFDLDAIIYDKLKTHYRMDYENKRKKEERRKTS